MAPATGARGDPPAGGEHGALVVLVDAALAGLALVEDLDDLAGVALDGRGRIGAAFEDFARVLVGNFPDFAGFPPNLAPLQPLFVRTVGARDVIAALVRGRVEAFDAAGGLELRARHAEDLAAGERLGALLGHQARIALAADIEGIGVDLVHHQESHGHATQAGPAVGAGEHQDAAGEFLHQDGVAGVAAAAVADLVREARALLDHRREPLLADALRGVGRGHHQHRRGGPQVDDRGEPVVAGLRAADLGALHEVDLAARVRGR